MTISKFTIEFYTKTDGAKPAEEFLDKLDNKMRAKMIRVIQTFKAKGTELREPYSKHLDDGIFEFRSQVGNNISRVLYFFIVGRRAILTHGFIKKTNKTPPDEIQKAKRYRRCFLNRKENTDD